MKIISINSAPTMRDEDDIIRHDLTSLDAILNNFDTEAGRNDALREYIFALRDLQHENDRSSYPVNNGAAVHAAQVAVEQAFGRLFDAEMALWDQDHGK